MDRLGVAIRRVPLPSRFRRTFASSTSRTLMPTAATIWSGLRPTAAPSSGLAAAPSLTTGRSSALAAPRSSATARINSFGLGGEIEVRAGLLVQKQVIRRPGRPFRPGRPAQAPTLPGSSGPTERHRWSSTPRPTTWLIAEQRLKGSCPFLYRVRRQGRAVRDRFHLEVAAGPSHQRPGHGRASVRPKTGSRSAATSSPPGRCIRRSDHRRALGNALLRPRVAPGGRPPGGNRSLRRRAIRTAAAASRRAPDRARCIPSPLPATIRAAT